MISPVPVSPFALRPVLFGLAGWMLMWPSWGDCQELPTPSITSLMSRPIGEYVVATFEDREGQLWFGTLARGAARWDGQKFRYFTQQDGLIENRVVDFAQDRQGHLWLAHGDRPGVTQWNGKKWTTWGKAQGLPGRVSTVTSDRQGRLWAGSDQGAFVFDGFRFNNFDIPKSIALNPSYKIALDSVWCIHQDRRGRLWFGTDGNGVFCHDGHRFQHYTHADGLCSNSVIQIAEDHQGQLWFASIASRVPQVTTDGGLSRFDGKRFHTFDSIAGLHDNDIYLLYADSNQQLWIGSAGVGAFRYDGQEFEKFSKTDRPDLTRNFGLQAMIEDRHGNLWCGFSGGLFRFESDRFMHISIQGPWKK